MTSKKPSKTTFFVWISCHADFSNAGNPDGRMDRWTDGRKDDGRVIQYTSFCNSLRQGTRTGFQGPWPIDYTVHFALGSVIINEGQQCLCSWLILWLSCIDVLQHCTVTRPGIQGLSFGLLHLGYISLICAVSLPDDRLLSLESISRHYIGHLFIHYQIYMVFYFTWRSTKCKSEGGRSIRVQNHNKHITDEKACTADFSRRFHFKTIHSVLQLMPFSSWADALMCTLEAGKNVSRFLINFRTFRASSESKEALSR